MAIINSCYKRDEKPSDVLNIIYKLELKKKYKNMEKYFYNVEFRDIKTGEFIFNSRDQFIDAIKKEGKVYGAFEYSRKGLLYHKELIDKMIIESNDELNKKYLINYYIADSSMYVKYLIKNKKEDILYYINGYTVFIFIKHDSNLKILFTTNMGVIKKDDTEKSIEEKK